MILTCDILFVNMNFERIFEKTTLLEQVFLLDSTIKKHFEATYSL